MPTRKRGRLVEFTYGKVSSKTSSCMSDIDLLRYALGIDTVVDKYKDHYESCPNYCQKAVNILSKSPNSFLEKILGIGEGK